MVHVLGLHWHGTFLLRARIRTTENTGFGYVHATQVPPPLASWALRNVEPLDSFLEVFMFQFLLDFKF